MEKNIKKRDGFQGEKLISIPPRALRRMLQKFPAHQLYVTHIGYFPEAKYHYKNRPNGCEDDILFYCLKGKGYYMIDGTKYELHANQYVIVPATCKSLCYWADPEHPWTIYWVHFTGREIDAFNLSLDVGVGRPVYIPYNEEGVKIWNRIYDILSMGYSSDNMMHASLRLYHMVETFRYPQKHTQQAGMDSNDRIAKNTMYYMEANIEKRLTLEKMAGINNLSPSRFSMLFRMSTGMSPVDYFIHLKMRKACQLLHTTELLIKEVASMIGYDDPYYFSRIFKKSINISPEKYRAMMINGHPSKTTDFPNEAKTE